MPWPRNWSKSREESIKPTENTFQMSKMWFEGIFRLEYIGFLLTPYEFLQIHVHLSSYTQEELAHIFLQWYTNTQVTHPTAG